MMNVPFVDLSRIHRPIQDELTEAIQSVINQSAFILGPQVETFEHSFATYSGSLFGIGVANGTDGLLLALKAAGIKEGDEVITASHTFISTALAISYCGAIPIFADIDEDSYTLDPTSVEKCITKKTKAILPVALYGQPVSATDLSELAKKYKLKLIIDNCQAHGATYKHKPVGSYGDACSYSFYPAKNLGAFGDGGFVTTNSSEIEQTVRLLRNIGRTEWYTHPIKGYNSRLDTIHAAVLSIKLKYLDDWNTKRQMIAAKYEELLSGVPIVLPKIANDRTHVFHLYVVRVKERELFINFLKTRGIHTAIHYPIPIHKQKAYKELSKSKLPITEKISKEIVSLPMFPGLTNEEIEYTTDTIKNFFQLKK